MKILFFSILSLMYNTVVSQNVKNIYYMQDSLSRLPLSNLMGELLYKNESETIHFRTDGQGSFSSNIPYTETFSVILYKKGELICKGQVSESNNLGDHRFELNCQLDSLREKIVSDSARIDLKNCNIKILVHYSSIFGSSEIVNDSLENKYGFRYIADYSSNNSPENIINYYSNFTYNQVMYKYLDSINGDDWEVRVLKDVHRWLFE